MDTEREIPGGGELPLGAPINPNPGRAVDALIGKIREAENEREKLIGEMNKRVPAKPKAESQLDYLDYVDLAVGE